MRSLAFLALMTGTALAADTVKLQWPDPLTSRSSFEIRFSEPMVSEHAVGKTAESPFVIRPKVPGQFVWASQRSGVFTPTQALPLNTTFQFTLAPDLKK